MSTYRTALNQISLFVLLDLLGSAQPIVPSYFPTTHWAYQNMAVVERRMRALRSLKAAPSTKDANGIALKEPMFLLEGKKDTGPSTFWLGGAIEDDHLPFMARGVPILHMIPDPFPHVWHTPQDDGPHLDMQTTEDWAKIVTGFTAEWMELEGFMPTTSKLTIRNEPLSDEGFLEEDEWEFRDELARERDEL
jgi:glutaminyl-peptide cyclotransferase